MGDSDFKAGENVFIDSSRYGEPAFRPAVVKRVTKTLAIVETDRGNERKFSQRDGRQVPAGEWHDDKLVRNSERVQKAFLDEQARDLARHLRDAAQRVITLDPTTEQFDAVYAAFNNWTNFNYQRENA